LKGTEAKLLVANEADFVYLKRFDFSLSKLVERHPTGVPDRIIAAALMVTEDDVRDMYEEIVLKLRQTMKVEL
jgi:hypothetical protein